MKFYTSVSRQGDYILERGYEDGRSYQKKFKYSPYLFQRNKDGEYKTIHDEPCSRIDFKTMGAANQFIKEYKDVVGKEIYGLTDFPFLYIYDNYAEGFKYDFHQLSIVNIDIENSSRKYSDTKKVKIRKHILEEFEVQIRDLIDYRSEYEVWDENLKQWVNVDESEYFKNPVTGFADIDTADKEITAITFAKSGKTISLGYFPYESSDDEQYIQCADEVEFLRLLIKIWNSKEWSPDIITGWNVDAYDIPYIVNRIERILGEGASKKLSPFGVVRPRKARDKNRREYNTYIIAGVAILDYYHLYLKFAQNQRESYKLDYIAEIELKQNKLDYSEYGSLDGLYRNDFKKFMDYNKLDTLLIGRLEDKLHYIAQAVSMAYIQRVNFENTLATVKPWDINCHNFLLDRNIVVPQFELDEGFETIPGGYVKDPVPDHYTWLVTVDFTSLYPSVAIQYNISPDTYVRQFDSMPDFDQIIHGDMSAFTEELVRRDLSMTANGVLFKRDKRGFVPTLMQKFFDERVRVRKLEAIAKTEWLKDEKNDKLRNEFLAHKNLQTGFKLINNSGYGSLANKYFRWFSNPLAEGITLSGQLTTQYVIVRINEYLNDLFDTKDFDYVVYADTDSAYIRLDKLVEKLDITDERKITEALVIFGKKHLTPYIDKVSQELAKKMNCYEWKTSMKLEKVCSQAFFIRKKKYALYVNYDEGDFFDKPQLKVTGLETVRSSSPKIVRDALKKCFELIFSKDRDSLALFIEEFRKEFRQLPFDKIGKPTGVNNFNEYLISPGIYKKACPIHVRGSYVYNQFLVDNDLTNKYELIVDHDKVKHCYLRMPNPTFSNVISIKGDVPKELDIEKYLDYELQFEKTFLAPIRKVCDAVDWDIRKVYTLNDFFGDD